MLTRLRDLHTRLTSPPWGWQLGFNRRIDFGVWVLETDGLRVAPFDQHPDGDAALRGVGLTAQAWREWFARVAATQHINRDVAGERRRLAVDPPSLWDGPPVIGDRLRDLWQAYAPTSEQRCAWDGQTTSLVRSRPSQQLWLDLRPYHNRLESLSVHLVPYATTVECLVPPTGVVLGVPGTLPDATTFRAAVLRSAERLATSVVMAS